MTLTGWSVAAECIAGEAVRLLVIVAVGVAVVAMSVALRVGFGCTVRPGLVASSDRRMTSVARNTSGLRMEPGRTKPEIRLGINSSEIG